MHALGILVFLISSKARLIFAVTSISLIAILWYQSCSSVPQCTFVAGCLY